MKATIYANYGVLAAEKRVIYTINAPHTHATASEKIEVEIPEKLNPYVTEMDDIGIEPDGSYAHLLSEVLFTHGDSPAVRYAEKEGTYRIVVLPVIH